MRDIKFRAWNDGEMVFNLGLDPACVPYAIPEGAENFESFEYYPEATLMEFTGLRDRSGKDVYEGDVVICDSSLRCPHEVYWREAAPFSQIGGWGLRGTNDRYDWVGGEEVIGNIYENPELLEGGDAA